MLNTCLRSTTKIADNWTLDRVRISCSSENQVGQCCLPRFYRTLSSIRGSVASSDGPNHRIPSFIAVLRPQSLIYKAQIWHAHSSCINLLIRSKTRAAVTRIGAMQPSNTVGCLIIDWLYTLHYCNLVKLVSNQISWMMGCVHHLWRKKNN